MSENVKRKPKVFYGCRLPAETVAAIKKAAKEGGISGAQVVQNGVEAVTKPRGGTFEVHRGRFVETEPPAADRVIGVTNEVGLAKTNTVPPPAAPPIRQNTKPFSREVQLHRKATHTE